MTTLIPLVPYTDTELNVLFPKNLQLEQVQIILRHGERSPVSPRFQNTGLTKYWPYCGAANRLASAIATADGWETLTYRRRLETFGLNDLPTIEKGPKNEVNSICQPGELTDRGRETTRQLGQRLRALYVDRLHFLPDNLANPSILYLRTTPIPRALESLQQAFIGLYPSSKRSSIGPLPTILTRTAVEETLFPNDTACRRLAQLAHAFAERTAQRWNESEDMDYLNRKIGKWMPERSPRVLVDSHPRLSGIMDTLNGTLAHGEETRLPKEFYDTRVREIIDRIAVEEWFSGYSESREYRTLGIGGLAGDMVTRMVGHVEKSHEDGSREINDEGSNTRMRFALSGAHDTTLAALLTSLGAFKGQSWPPFTSHIAMELFRTREQHASSVPVAPSKPSWWTTLFSFGTPNLSSCGTTQDKTISRTPTPDLSPSQKSLLDEYYVRIRYNDRSVTVPGCRVAGKHLEGDESFCTLAAFKEIVDKFTPKDWLGACRENLEAKGLPERIEEAGF